MPVFTPMKTLVLLVLFFLMACGRDSSVKSATFQKEIAAKWTISSNAVSFPHHFELKLNGLTVLNTCTELRSAKVSEEAGRALIEFNYNWIPDSAFQVDILDLGEECDNNAIFHQENSVVYGVIELRSGEERSYSVSVNLYN